MKSSSEAYPGRNGRLFFPPRDPGGGGGVTVMLGRDVSPLTPLITSLFSGRVNVDDMLSPRPFSRFPRIQDKEPSLLRGQRDFLFSSFHFIVKKGWTFET